MPSCATSRMRSPSRCARSAVCSVTSNTRRDGEELLVLAQRVGLEVTTTPVPFEHADRALHDLAEGHIRGATVLTLTS